METLGQAAGPGAPWWRRPWMGLRRPAGIRNGGLLLLLVGLAAVMALVDKPPEPGAGPRLPGVLQHLPPPIGIVQEPPVEQPPGPPATGRLGALAGADSRSVDGRRHPRREHPRPVRSGSAGSRRGGAGAPPAGGGGQGRAGGSGSPVAQPPDVGSAVATAGVRVPSVTVRVRPPSVVGRDLPEVRASRPEVAVDTAAVQMP
jgi:hypothetical protein